MPDNSFDVVSQIEMPEVNNAIQQAMKEVTTRYDLKDSKSLIELNEKDKKLTLTSSDDFKLKAVTEILQSKLVKRQVPIKNLTYGTVSARGRIHGEAGSHADFGHSDRKGQRHRQEDQGQQAQGAGRDTGRSGSRQREGP